MTTMGAESFAAFHSSDESAGSDHARSTSSASTHSAVAYLFGGIASMIGLIALAILILACAYWKLSGRRFDEVEEEEEEGDVELGQMKNDCTLFEEKILVIMAGDEKPTFIATPITSRASSFASHGSTAAATTTTTADGELDTPAGRSDDHVASQQ